MSMRGIFLRLCNTQESRRAFSVIAASGSTKSELCDSFGRRHNYLRMSLTERCNLRCVYCMPEGGVELTPDPQLPTLDERKRLLSRFIDRFGVDKLRFTGGEPTISPHLLPLIQLAKEKGVKNIGITTNGLVLEKHLEKLVEAGMNSVNISLDTTNPKKFAKLSRRDAKSYDRVRSSLQAALDIAQREDTSLHVKLNCVLMRGINDGELHNFVSMTENVPLDVRFIEIMPFNGNGWDPKQVMGYKEALGLLEHGHGVTLVPTSRGSGEGNTRSSASAEGKQQQNQQQERHGFDVHDTTKWYRAAHGQGEGASTGRVGFITTMSSPFCGGCNRLRITANMRLKVCLFGEEEADLLAVMRRSRGQDDNAELEGLIERAVWAKHPSLGGHKAPEVLAEKENRSMIMIGG